MSVIVQRMTTNFKFWLQSFMSFLMFWLGLHVESWSWFSPSVNRDKRTASPSLSCCSFPPSLRRSSPWCRSCVQEELEIGSTPGDRGGDDRPLWGGSTVTSCRRRSSRDHHSEPRERARTNLGGADSTARQCLKNSLF